MTGKDRVMRAADHRTSDRIPLTFDAEPDVYSGLCLHLNVATKEGLFDELHVDTWMILPTNFSAVPVPGTNQKESIWGFRTLQAEYSAGGTYDEICYFPLLNKETIRDIEAWHAPTLDDIYLYSG